MKMKTLLVGAAIAGAVGIAQTLATFDVEQVADWRMWFGGLVGAFVRPAAAYLVSKFVTDR